MPMYGDPVAPGEDLEDIEDFDELDVVVVNYQSPSDLRSFLQSYLDCPPLRKTCVHVVNVECTDADRSVLHEFTPRFPSSAFRVYEFKDNIGYARAVNYAVKRGHGATIAIFNADTRLTEGLLEGCSHALWSEDDWAILGPRQHDDNGRITSAGVFGTLENPQMRGWRSPLTNKYIDVREAVTVSGSAYFVKREVWEELSRCPAYKKMHPDAEGAFLPTPHYYEETWCSYHAQAHGYKVIYYGLFGMIHRWHKASPVDGWADKLMKESRGIFREMCDAHGIPHD